MDEGKAEQLDRIPIAALQKATVPRRKTVAEDERSVDIAMIRILARKRPAEFRKIAAELFGGRAKI